jgi:hypothetical protein
MNLQKEIEKHILMLKTDNTQDLCDLCLMLIKLNKLRSVIIGLDKMKIKSALRECDRLNRQDLKPLIELLQAVTVLENC